MKTLKIVQYIVSLLHLIAQIFYFIAWSSGMDKLPMISQQIDATFLSNTNLQMGQFSFLFIMLSLLSLAFYITVTFHLNLWINEARIEEIKEKEILQNSIDSDTNEE